MVSEPNYHALRSLEKTEIVIDKPVYLALSILELSRILMYEFWYDYVTPQYGEKAKVRYVDTDSFFVYMKTDDVYKDIEEDV